MSNTISSDTKFEKILHVVLDLVIDNSLYVEDERLVPWEHEFYNVLHILRCFEDTRLGIYNRIIERWYVVHELQRSTIRVAPRIFNL